MYVEWNRETNSLRVADVFKIIDDLCVVARYMHEYLRFHRHHLHRMCQWWMLRIAMMTFVIAIAEDVVLVLVSLKTVSVAVDHRRMILDRVTILNTSPLMLTSCTNPIRPTAIFLFRRGKRRKKEKKNTNACI